MRTAIFSLLALTILPLQAELTFKQKGNRISVLVDGKLFTEYRDDTRVPCLYPLMSPSGSHLTRQFPFVKGVEGEADDHKHHAGFWFTHGDVNGKDFWHKDNCKIVTKAILGKPLITKTISGGTGTTVTFTAELAWEVDGKRYLSEQRTYAITAAGKTRIIDVTCLLGATDGDVTFGDTKEGSFSIRVAPSLRQQGNVAKGHILTSEGKKDGDAWGKRARWVAYYGPDAKGTKQVVALMDHSSNLRHPTGWHARTYGLLTANPFAVRSFRENGDGKYVLAKDKTLTQRYRLVLHEGDMASANLEKFWKQFAAPKK